MPVTALKNYIASHTKGISLKSERVQERSALDAFTGVEQFELRRYRLRHSERIQSQSARSLIREYIL